MTHDQLTNILWRTMFPRHHAMFPLGYMTLSCDLRQRIGAAADAILALETPTVAKPGRQPSYGEPPPHSTDRERG